MGGGGGGGIQSTDLSKLEEKARQHLREGGGAGTHVFISFDHDDESEINLLRGQAKNDLSDLEFDDFSLKDAVKSNDDNYIKQKICERIDRASVTVVYLTPNSAISRWVSWEIEESLRRGKGVIGVYKGDSPPVQLPAAFNRHNLETVKWSHKELMQAIERARKNR